jgi:DNA polymerase/3'-5' exonuclease PolX
MELQKAAALAQNIIETMRPYCQRVEVGGSIRREKPDVKDIEIICIPKWNEQFNLLGEVSTRTNLLMEWAESLDDINWIKPGTSEVVEWHVKPEGKYWRGILPDYQIKLDLFIAEPSNYGLIKMIRTGSSEFSRQAVTKLWSKGLQSRDGHLWRNRERVECREEEDFFALAGIDWIEPRERHGVII